MLRMTVFLFVLVLCRTSSGTVPLDEFVLSHLSAIDHLLPSLQLSSEAVRYTEIRRAIADREFPVADFSVTLSRLAKDTEKSVHSVSREMEAFMRRWRAFREEKAFEEALSEKRIMHALAEVYDIYEFCDKALRQAETAASNMAGINEVVSTTYIPPMPAQKLFQSWGLQAELVAFLVAILCPLLYVVKSWRFRLVVVPLAVVAVVIASLTGHMLIRDSLRRFIGPPAPVARVILLAEGGVLEAAAFVEGARAVVGHLKELVTYCEHLGSIDESIVNSLTEFSKHVADIRSTDGVAGNRAEVAQALVTSTRNVLREQRIALMKSPSHSDRLRRLVDMIDHFDLMLAQASLSVYVNLRTGGQVNALLATYLDKLNGYIDSGNLRECRIVLERIRSEQSNHKEAISLANSFLRNANDAIERIRTENTRLQPEFATIEFDAWVKRMAVNAATVVSAVGTPAATAMAGAVGVAAIAPTAALGVAIAALGYHWSNAFASSEQEAKGLIKVMMDIDPVLQKTENMLSDNERLLALIMDDINSVLVAVNQSDRRFTMVQTGRIFTTHEVDLLKTGVRRLIDSVEVLAASYNSAADQMEREATRTPLYSSTEKAASGALLGGGGVAEKLFPSRQSAVSPDGPPDDGRDKREPNQ